MNSDPPKFWKDVEALARNVVDTTDGHIVLAIPLGLGKPVQLVNALTRHATVDKGISLTILTALTLEKPVAKNFLEKRFLDPILERLFNDYVDLDYPGAIRKGILPENIKVKEFFLVAGQWFYIDTVQQNYISTNYTHVCKLVIDAGVNVVAQLVAPPPNTNISMSASTYSLSCNPDITLPLLEARAKNIASFRMIGQVNANLPYMSHDAEISDNQFNDIFDGEEASLGLFNILKRPVSLTNYAAGFRVARLIPDGGTMQIGIGSVGDALAYALIMRHQKNDDYQRIIGMLDSETYPAIGDDRPFEEGLYGVSEMLVDTFLDLIDTGVVKREINGICVHGAFFLGPQSFYKRIREWPTEKRNKIGMSSIHFVNDVYCDYEDKYKNRKNARFINNAMKATLLGAVVSDGLENGQIVSGVGGQFDFVTQAYALDGARSIIMLNAVREGENGVESNIVWSYGHMTIPRHYRDIVVTEYGIADLHGKSDMNVIIEMLSIADARFHDNLIEQAKKYGKLPVTFKKPDKWKRNTPDYIQDALYSIREEGLAPAFPFGTDFTKSEQDILSALDQLKSMKDSKSALVRTFIKGLTSSNKNNRKSQVLQRMSLKKPSNIKEYFYRYLILGALKIC